MGTGTAYWANNWQPVPLMLHDSTAIFFLFESRVRVTFLMEILQIICLFVPHSSYHIRDNSKVVFLNYLIFQVTPTLLHKLAQVFLLFAFYI